MTPRAGVASFTPILTAAALILLLAASVVAKEPGRFVAAGRPTPLAPDRGDLPPTVITQSFLDLVDDAEGSDSRSAGDDRRGTTTPARNDLRSRTATVSAAPPAAAGQPGIEALPPSRPLL